MLPKYQATDGLCADSKELINVAHVVLWPDPLSGQDTNHGEQSAGAGPYGKHPGQPPVSSFLAQDPCPEESGGAGQADAERPVL